MSDSDQETILAKWDSDSLFAQAVGFLLKQISPAEDTGEILADITQHKRERRFSLNDIEKCRLASMPLKIEEAVDNDSPSLFEFTIRASVLCS